MATSKHVATPHREEPFRERANELRRMANRPDPSSLRDALLAAAREWDELADKVRKRQKQ